MIVVRYTHTAKPGKRNEIIELLKGWVEGAGVSGRVLTPGYANWDAVEIEVEWETEEDRRKFWAGYDSIRSRPRVAEFHEKLSDLRESGSTRVQWQTH
jgi:hypothetical protein